MQNDIYINILKFAHKKGQAGLSYREFKDEFGDDKKAIFISALNHTSFIPKPGNREETGILESYYLLSFEGNFRLLEYNKLEHARESALNATRFAIAALVIVMISTTLSIYYSFEQINTPIELSQTQLTTLDGSATRDLVNDINKKQHTIHSELRIIAAELKIISGALEEIYSHNQTYPRGSN